MFTKLQLFNLALDALSVQKVITDAEADQSNEVKRLRSVYEIALMSALEQMDLDSTFETVTLEKLDESPSDLWLYAYKKPNDCILFRRLISWRRKDTVDTQIPFKGTYYDGQNVILTDLDEAKAEIVTKDYPLGLLSPHAFLAVAYTLAFLSSSLISGKSAVKLKQTVVQLMTHFITQAQVNDTSGGGQSLSDLLMESNLVQTRL